MATLVNPLLVVSGLQPAVAGTVVFEGEAAAGTDVALVRAVLADTAGLAEDISGAQRLKARMLMGKMRLGGWTTDGAIKKIFGGFPGPMAALLAAAKKSGSPREAFVGESAAASCGEGSSLRTNARFLRMTASGAQRPEANQGRTEAFRRAQEHFRRSEYYEAGWNYITANERAKALECAKRLRWERQFSYALEIYENLGAAEEQAETLYEAGSFDRAALLYIQLHSGDRKDYSREILACAHHARFLGNSEDAARIIEAFARAAEDETKFEFRIGLYRTIDMEERIALMRERKGEFQRERDERRAARLWAIARSEEAKLTDPHLYSHDREKVISHWFDLAVVLERLGRLSEAAEAYEKIGEIKVEKKYSLVPEARYAGVLHYSLENILSAARLYDRLGRREDAARVLALARDVGLKKEASRRYREMGNNQRAGEIDKDIERMEEDRRERERVEREYQRFLSKKEAADYPWRHAADSGG